MQKAIFSQGHEVGKLARQLFPGGVDASIYVPDQCQKSIELSSRLINEGCQVIYEAGFDVDNLHCFIDILVRDGEMWKAYEVKSSTQIKHVNLLDAAFQYYVMTHSSVNISDISLITLDTDYKRSGDLDLFKLFKITSVLEPVLKLQDKVKTDASTFLATLDLPDTPEIDIGPHCTDPYICDFRGFCWQHIPEYSIFNISRLDAKRKWELYRQGILKFEDIPADFSLNVSQWQQVISELKGETHINRPAIQKFLDGLNFPLYFLDFESFQPAVPLFDHSKPYQQIVFQYSLHIQETENSELKHTAFLAEANGMDPRPAFVSRLIEDIGDTGDILVFNRSFEAGRLNEIASSFPNFQLQISDFVSRIKDLMLIFQYRYLYVPAMKGSYSIKQVLPALVPGFSYDNLEIADGGSASHAYMSLYSEKDEEKIHLAIENLLEYCKLDTLAMVEILKTLRKLNS